MILYKHTIDQNHGNFILAPSETLEDGFFYGTEFQANGVPVYYKSTIDSVKISDNNVSFELGKYEFSTRPFGEEGKYSDEFPNKGEVPILLQFPLRFLGEFSGNELRLKRISGIYDSRFDEMLFLRQ